MAIQLFNNPALIKRSLLKLKRKIVIGLLLKSHFTFVAAGMPRSGSTRAFNNIMSSFKNKYPNLVIRGFWIDDQIPLNADILIVKLHDIENYSFPSSQPHFYTYRNLHDALHSYSQVFGISINNKIVDSFVAGFRKALNHPENLIGIDELDNNQIYQKILEISPNFRKRNFLIKRMINLLNYVLCSLTPAKQSKSMINSKYSNSTLYHQNHIQNIEPNSGIVNLDQEILSYINAYHKDLAYLTTLKGADLRNELQKKCIF